MTAALFSGSAGLLTFIDHLKFKAAALSQVNLAFSHLMTILHGIYLLL